MRQLFNLSTALATTLGLSLILGCSQPSSTSTSTEPKTTRPTAEDSQSTDRASLDSDTEETQVLEDTPPAVFNEDNIAIRGADPVAYFTDNNYVKGTADYTYEWADVTWHFANAENRDLFADNPQQYAPQYGGFCAWAVSQGYTAPVDPNAWKIVDGKLYMNYDTRIQRRWERDIAGNIAKANENWPGVVN